MILGILIILTILAPQVPSQIVLTQYGNVTLSDTIKRQMIPIKAYPDNQYKLMAGITSIKIVDQSMKYFELQQTIQNIDKISLEWTGQTGRFEINVAWITTNSTKIKIYNSQQYSIYEGNFKSSSNNYDQSYSQFLIFQRGFQIDWPYDMKFDTSLKEVSQKVSDIKFENKDQYSKQSITFWIQVVQFNNDEIIKNAQQTKNQATFTIDSKTFTFLTGVNEQAYGKGIELQFQPSQPPVASQPTSDNTQVPKANSSQPNQSDGTVQQKTSQPVQQNSSQSSSATNSTPTIQGTQASNSDSVQQNDTSIQSESDSKMSTTKSSTVQESDRNPTENNPQETNSNVVQYNESSSITSLKSNSQSSKQTIATKHSNSNNKQQTSKNSSKTRNSSTINEGYVYQQLNEQTVCKKDLTIRLESECIMKNPIGLDMVVGNISFNLNKNSLVEYGISLRIKQKGSQIIFLCISNPKKMNIKSVRLQSQCDNKTQLFPLSIDTTQMITTSMKNEVTEKIEKVQKAFQKTNRHIRLTLFGIGLPSMFLNSPQFYTLILFIDTKTSPVTYGILRLCSFWVVPHMPAQFVMTYEVDNPVKLFYLINMTDYLCLSQDQALYNRAEISTIFIVCAWQPLTFLCISLVALAILSMINRDDSQSKPYEKKKSTFVFWFQGSIIKSNLNLILLCLFVCFKYFNFAMVKEPLYIISFFTSIVFIVLYVAISFQSLNTIQTYLINQKNKLIMTTSCNESDEESRKELMRRFSFFNLNNLQSVGYLRFRFASLYLKIVITLLIVLLVERVEAILTFLALIKGLTCLSYLISYECFFDKKYLILNYERDYLSHLMINSIMFVTIVLQKKERGTYLQIENSSELYIDEQLKQKFLNDGQIVLNLIMSGLFFELFYKLITLTAGLITQILNQKKNKLQQILTQEGSKLNVPMPIYSYKLDEHSN